MLSESFNMEVWVKAWSGNKQMIVGGVNDEFRGLPPLGAIWDWLLVRELTGEHPTYRLVLLYDDENDGWVTVARGKIDKTMYGEQGVLELARTMKERHCPTSTRPTASTGAPTDPTGRTALIARRTTRSARPRPETVSA